MRTRMTSMVGLTCSDRPTRAATPTPRLPRITRNTRLPIVGRLTGLRWLDRLTRAIGITRMTGIDRQEVLYTLTVTDRRARPIRMVILTRRHRIIRR